METNAQTWEQKRNRIAERIRTDPQAPRYHFIAPEGNALPFDPNGAIFWKGLYHLFYIFQDPALPNGGHCWGHASSPDLLHWTFHPTALAPDPGGETMIFSGGAFVNKEGVPTIIYHGVNAGTCIATAEDDLLIRWKKSPHNPVIPETKPGTQGWGIYNVFDPHAWLEGDTYYVILGGKIKPYDLRDTAYLFRSKDLIRWEYLRPFYSPHPDWTGPEEDCACPDFFKLGDRHMLVCISHPRGARYYLGRYQEGTFIPEEHHRMNWAGGSCFAPETLLDGQGRRVFWAWVLDQRKGEWIVKNELGVMTMPRVLSLDSRGQLLINPPAEFESLRRNPRHREALTVTAGQEVPLTGITGDVMELALEASVPAPGVFGLKVRMTPDGAEQTSIRVDTVAHTLSVDTSRASLSQEVAQRFPLMRVDGLPIDQAEGRVQTAPFALEPDEPLRLRVFLDKSILEVYANGRQCVTQRIYPTRDDSLGLACFSGKGTTVVRRLDAWEMEPTNGVLSPGLARGA